MCSNRLVEYDSTLIVGSITVPSFLYRIIWVISLPPFEAGLDSFNLIVVAVASISTGASGLLGATLAMIVTGSELSD